ncbi:MAG: DNA-3-methyladenine glycosylase [Candidatus Nanohaloarchaea archaeon]
MRTYRIQEEDLDLEETMTCGQTFCWHRVSGELYSDGQPHFYSFRDGKPLIVEETEEGVEVRTELDREEVERALGLHHDLEEVFSTFPEDETLELARDELWGLRLLQDDPFACLVSYLCSPQMQIPRIKRMHNAIADRWGETTVIDGVEMRRFPGPSELSDATEQELREIGVGYRAEYIERSVEKIENGFSLEETREMDYTDARDHLKQLHGVGDKVADCVLLFSLGFYEAAPLDTWARKALKVHYPGLHSENYAEASENIRDHFGEYAGYAQEYIFHAARTGLLEV